jgi:hypothetical protein
MVNIEYRNRDSNFGAMCWSPVPAYCGITLEEAKKFMERFASPGIEYRAVEVLLTKAAHKEAPNAQA